MQHPSEAIKIEPTSAIYTAGLSWIYVTAKRFKEAIEAARFAIELDNNNFLAHYNMGNAYIGCKEFDAAIATFKTALNISERNQTAIDGLIRAYCGKGEFDKALPLYEEMKAKEKHGYAGKVTLALSSVHMGYTEVAIDYFKKALEERDPLLLTLKHVPYLPEHFMTHPEFQQVLKTINFPD